MTFGTLHSSNLSDQIYNDNVEHVHVQMSFITNLPGTVFYEFGKNLFYQIFPLHENIKVILIAWFMLDYAHMLESAGLCLTAHIINFTLRKQLNFLNFVIFLQQ